MSLLLTREQMFSLEFAIAKIKTPWNYLLNHIQKGVSIIYPLYK
jgi:hypothetical protein